MAVNRSAVCLLVFVLIQAIQDAPVVSARNPLESPSLSDFVKGITDTFGAPPVPIPGVNSPPLSFPPVPGPTVSKIAKDITDALGAPPVRIPGVNSPPLEFPHVSGPSLLPTVTDVTNAITNALGAPPVKLPTVAELSKEIADAFNHPSSFFTGVYLSELPPLTAVTQSHTFSIPSVGTTTITVTVDIPSFDKSKIPDLKRFLTKFLPTTYSAFPFFPSTTFPSFPAPGFPFPKFPGTT